MASHGVTTAQLHRDLQELDQYQITNWTETHGESLAAMATAIDEEAEALYVYPAGSDRFYPLLQGYVAEHLEELRGALATIERPGGGAR